MEAETSANHLPRPRAHRPTHSPGLSVGAAWAASIAYASVLIAVPWSSIRGEPFFDLSVYLEGFDLGAYDYLDQLEGLAYFFSEPLWRQLVAILTTAFGDISTTFQIISFAVSTIYAYTMLRANRLTALFLSGPLLIDLVLSQVRSAVAGALFLIAILAGSTILWIGVLAIAPLVHSAALLLFGTFAVAAGLNRLWKTYPRAAMVLAVGTSVVLPFAFAASYTVLLSSLGDRRAETEAAWPGGVFVLTFGIYYGVLLLNLNRAMKHTLSIFSLIVCGLFIVLAMFDINMLRFISLTFPLLIVTAFRLPFVERLLLLSTLLSMCVYHLVLWL